MTERAEANAIAGDNADEPSASDLRTLIALHELPIDSVPLETLYLQIAQITADIIPHHHFCITLEQPARSTLAFSYRSAPNGPSSPAEPLLAALSRQLMTRHRPLAWRHEELTTLSSEQPERGHTGPCLGAPLLINQRAVGAILVQHPNHSYRYRKQQQQLLLLIAHYIANALSLRRIREALQHSSDIQERRVHERTELLLQANLKLKQQLAQQRAAEQRLQHQVNHDSLTRLANRSRFITRLRRTMQSARREGRERRYAVLFLDLDRFKIINDSLGHLVGDHLLQAVAQRLRHCVRNGDMVARMGGDEFAILLTNIGSERASLRIAERIHKAFVSAFQILGQPLFTSASIGIARGNRHYQQPEEILRDADSAMYHAKSQGPANSVLFSQELLQNAVRIQRLENELHQAIQHDQFVVYFQPIYRLKDNVMVGVEALCRWQHPALGLIPPGEFIQLAEEAGLVTQLDMLVLRQAASQVTHWNRYRPANAQLFLSINLSGQHFYHTNLPQQILQVLEQTGLSPQRLKLEVTERAMTQHHDQLKAMILTLQGLGIGVSMDDFGRGQSSLNYLCQFALDTLKIDRNFIKEMLSSPQTQTIIETISLLARSLKLPLIASGIETETQRQQLVAMDIPYGQGYLLGKPRPVVG